LIKVEHAQTDPTVLNALVVSILSFFSCGKCGATMPRFVHMGGSAINFRKAYDLPTMPITNYSILKGDPQPGQVTGFHPHFRIPVQTDAQGNPSGSSAASA
jgi:hypothetical protein